jgi:hypothetical protein
MKRIKRIYFKIAAVLATLAALFVSSGAGMTWR